MQNPLWGKRKGETECRFIIWKNYPKHSVLIRSDRNATKLSKVYMKVY